jgi:hypothetical protein
MATLGNLDLGGLASVSEAGLASRRKAQ